MPCPAEPTALRSLTLTVRGGFRLRLGTVLTNVECGLGSDKAAQVKDGPGVTAETLGSSAGARPPKAQGGPIARFERALRWQPIVSATER